MDKTLDNLIAQLQQDKSLKVWSLIITFFGDAVIARGGNVSAKTVQRVLAAMGIGSGAVRTALSRLASDHWVERQKAGRESHYKLAKDGYEPFQQAAVRIYAPVAAVSSEAKKNSIWQLAIARPGSDFGDVSDNGIPLAANCRLYPELDNVPNNLMVLSGQLKQVPPWVTESMMPESVGLGYQTLVSRFGAIREVDQLSPLDCLVMRCLIIHEWRRLLLRTPIVPDELQGTDWPEKECRQFVALRYQQLVVKSEWWLDENATCLDGSLPVALDAVKKRFTPDFTLT